MNLKIQIKNYVKENSKNDKDWKYNSANYLSQKLQVSRNIVSQYLNEFVRDGSFGKINSRPVLFFKLQKHSDVPVVFSKLVDARKWYQSVQEVGLDRVIGNTGSLKRIITEIKAAIQYPPNGLPILLMGSTGTGKSYLANMIYQHLMLNHNINKQSKFISINCSEYSNNPELFLANLFGVVRGAYTGAITDKKGIIELADNGVLFLDEIHSLNKECQEKLFQFMDTNKFHRLGDNEKVCESHCWIIFATSEDPKQYILPTLLRRIPVKISLPNLSNRTIYEKRELISEFFKHESHRLKKEIVLSYSLLDFLLNYTFKENVGNLKNVIQLACANAYAHQLSSKIVKIKLADLPNEMAKMTHKMNIRYPINKYLKLSELSQNYGQLSFNQLINYFYYHWQSNPDNNHLFNDFDHYLKRHFLSNLQLTTNESYLEIKLNQFVKENEEYYQTDFDNFYITLTKLFLDSWLYQADNINITTKQLAEFNQMLKDTAGQALNLSEQFLQFCDIDVSLSSKIILTVLFKLMSGKEFQQRKLALIIAHGDNVASSIATTTNLLMKKYIFDAIDMPLTIDNNEVVKRVNNYLLGRINFKELLIFVDMGSLEKIIPQLRISDQQKVGILNNVSTGIALEAANQYINLNVPLNDILSNIKNNQKI
ncbi:sigma 54-interacting transcriptional regulator [Bombilactobacillus bombi]|uniref:sigma 54-interacting transcriptional regulator n=1 Tax=Bombilactobacillus bombi TaxID=1303590 RepID=UPI0021755129|nr:sigma 54-interacting transcriptional regulator [Bombilactobacillus bombi]